jgi:L-ribulose-5-phosphate 4-epimerase
MLAELKEAVCAANLALNDAGLVLLTWGNVSGYDPDSGLVAIKPSGVSYDLMRPEHMVLVDLDGEVVEGELRPSSDTPTHLVLYREFAGLRGVAHSHSTHATAWAQARRPLPCYGTTHADNFRGSVPLTADMTPDEVGGAYELETGHVIVRAFAAGPDPLQVPGVLVAGHGPFTWGHSPAHAVENSIVLEQVARMALLTEQVDRAAQPIADYLQDKHFLRKHGAGAYYGQGGYRR